MHVAELTITLFIYLFFNARKNNFAVKIIKSEVYNEENVIIYNATAFFF